MLFFYFFPHTNSLCPNQSLQGPNSTVTLWFVTFVIFYNMFISMAFPYSSVTVKVFLRCYRPCFSWQFTQGLP
ncbi:hypothetical protein XELAEV_18009838mg [Xenopus laevis]|uniref:Uncharacterized protein n=1 Tax=Xenopus laevis TaxID=8355 RepID=A0A974I147_XENLA|nr:hypothetical protein XELAEV_18009838mg [Xenopus laevis]